MNDIRSLRAVPLIGERHGLGLWRLLLLLLLSGRALILAALGARGIKENKALAGDLYAEAVSRLQPWVSSSVWGADLLYNFQTKVLLLEYLQWSEGCHHPVWVEPMLDEMIHVESRDLAGMLKDTFSESAAHMSVEEELCQEEIRWTLWKFYCAMTRSSLIGIKLHPPRLFEALDLPGNPNHILTLSRFAGRESDGLVESIRSKNRGRGLTLPQVLSALLADDHRRNALPEMLSMVGQYIVLHAVLYLSDHMVEDFADVEVARRDPLGWQVETRERLYFLVMRWRQCFWIPPEILWSTSFPEFGSLQSIMFVVYLAARISQPVRGVAYEGRGRCSRHPYTRYAMRCIVTMHVNMKSNNLLEVAAKGRWHLDGATWRTGGLTVKHMMDWFRDRGRFGFEDDDIDFMQSLESVMAFYLFEGSYTGVSYSPARIPRMGWNLVLGDRDRGAAVVDVVGWLTETQPLPEPRAGWMQKHGNAYSPDYIIIIIIIPSTHSPPTSRTSSTMRPSTLISVLAVAVSSMPLPSPVLPSLLPLQALPLQSLPLQPLLGPLLGNLSDIILTTLNDLLGVPLGLTGGAMGGNKMLACDFGSELCKGDCEAACAKGPQACSTCLISCQKNSCPNSNRLGGKDQQKSWDFDETADEPSVESEKPKKAHKTGHADPARNPSNTTKSRV
ncbi:hypothetical protein NUW58_g2729 [Xylaria curta]|uniref:Uncharacterized protein n=1 Tax=Xylaria curta TaxID=42375 RepID=A0ACC1PE49_9PEZI|nr:hypothetical protein NUW58_g2729 [Xylaria curta]